VTPAEGGVEAGRETGLVTARPSVWVRSGTCTVRASSRTPGPECRGAADHAPPMASIDETTSVRRASEIGALPAFSAAADWPSSLAM